MDVYQIEDERRNQEDYATRFDDRDARIANLEQLLHQKTLEVENSDALRTMLGSQVQDLEVKVDYLTYTAEQAERNKKFFFGILLETARQFKPGATEDFVAYVPSEVAEVINRVATLTDALNSSRAIIRDHVAAYRDLEVQVESLTSERDELQNSLEVATGSAFDFDDGCENPY